jgi:predicted esterase
VLTAALEDIAGQRRAALIAPTGPVRTANGRAWFASQPGDEGPPLAVTVEAIETLAADACAERGLQPTRDLVVCGWSQGAAAALTLACRAGAKLRPPVVIALAPWLPNEPGVEWDLDAAATAGLRLLLVHGRSDDVVAVEQGRGTRRALERAGLDVTWVELDAGHDLTALVAAVPGWLGR